MLTVDLGGGFDISRVEISVESPTLSNKYAMETSLDGVIWTTCADRTMDDAPESLSSYSRFATLQYLSAIRGTGAARGVGIDRCDGLPADWPRRHAWELSALSEVALKTQSTYARPAIANLPSGAGLTVRGWAKENLQ